MPVAAIVGRPNVGKSALFNRLAGRRIAIVLDQPGVTRDRITAVCRLGRIPFEMIDTGGIGANLEDGFGEQVRLEADIAVHSADLIFFVVDAQEGLTPVDRELAGMLRRAGANTILVVNKIDVDKHEDLANEFAGLGFQCMVPVSAEHGRQIPELVTEANRRLGERFAPPAADSEDAVPPKKPIYLAIVGRPNVGKSSLVNAILDDHRTIVSDVAGTTRDAVDIPYERGGTPFVLIDTAGMRRRSRRESSVEVFSAMRSERSIRRASLCLLVIDLAAGVTAMERTIAQKIMEEEKPCVVVANKFDLFHPAAKRRDRLEEMRELVGRELFFLNYAPVVAVSALKGEFLSKIFGAIEQVTMASRQDIGTGQLNRFLREAIERNPPPIRRGRKLNLLYATAKKPADGFPIQAFRVVMFVNDRALMPRTYERYLENELRAAFDLTGLPVVLQVRSRQSEEKAANRSGG